MNTPCFTIDLCYVSVVGRALGGSSHSETSLPPTVGMRRWRDAGKRSERRRSSLFNPASVNVCLMEEMESQNSDVAKRPELQLDTGVTKGISAVMGVAEHATENTTAGGQRSLRIDPVDVSKAALVSELFDLAAVQNSTPEPPQHCLSRQTKRKAAQLATKPERGRKVERAPLKKPWEVKTQRNDLDLKK